MSKAWREAWSHQSQEESEERRKDSESFGMLHQSHSDSGPWRHLAHLRRPSQSQAAFLSCDSCITRFRQRVGVNLVRCSVLECPHRVEGCWRDTWLIAMVEASNHAARTHRGFRGALRKKVSWVVGWTVEGSRIWEDQESETRGSDWRRMESTWRGSQRWYHCIQQWSYFNLISHRTAHQRAVWKNHGARFMIPAASHLADVWNCVFGPQQYRAAVQGTKGAPSGWNSLFGWCNTQEDHRGVCHCTMLHFTLRMAAWNFDSFFGSHSYVDNVKLKRPLVVIHSDVPRICTLKIPTKRSVMASQRWWVQSYLSASKSPPLAQDVDYSSVSAATWSYFVLVSVAEWARWVRMNPPTVIGLVLNTSSVHFFPLKSPRLVLIYGPTKDFWTGRGHQSQVSGCLQLSKIGIWLATPIRNEVGLYQDTKMLPIPIWMKLGTGCECDGRLWVAIARSCKFYQKVHVQYPCFDHSQSSRM